MKPKPTGITGQATPQVLPMPEALYSCSENFCAEGSSVRVSRLRSGKFSLVRQELAPGWDAEHEVVSRATGLWLLPLLQAYRPVAM